MAAEADQRTEAASEKRLADARARGQVPIAAEVRHAAMLAALLAILLFAGGAFVRSLAALVAGLWGAADRPLGDGALTLAWTVARAALSALLPLFALTLGGALVGALVQGPLVLAPARLNPRWSVLVPWRGLGRLLGMRALVDFAKTLAKAGGVALLAALVLAPRLAGFDRLVGMTPGALGGATAGLAVAIVRTVAMLAGGIALVDVAWQRISFARQMRMSREELKEEHKEAEGDPAIKARVRQIQRARAARRMMAAVPDAAVVVTNPTHYAVALHYEHGKSGAPVVVAKGVDAVALRIRAVAGEAGVPVMEAPPLARALHATVEIGEPIPIEHYEAVAIIIGEVMKLARRAR